MLGFLPEALSPLFQTWPGIIVFYLAACAGHTFFMVTSLNVLYAWPLPHSILRFSRKLDVLVILCGPILFWFAMGLDGSAGVSWDAGGRGFFLTPYLVFCWMLGFFAFPVAMVLYRLRPVPAALIDTQVRMIDVAKELGYPPAGNSRQALLTRLPGNQAFQVDFVRRTLQLPQLPPAWDSLTILHLSDLHLCGTPDRPFFNYVMDRCRDWGTPDLLAVTGDVVDSSKHHRWIVPVLGRLRWHYGAFAILGNHDFWRDPPLIRRRLRKLGIHVLGNSWEQIEVRGQPMVVIGNEFPWFKPEADLSACPTGMFRLCLSHTPDRIAWCRRQHIDLMLAGHVHGGQIRLPFIGSVFVPSRYGRRYDCGVFYRPPTLMVVSRGLAGQHPLRFNCRPEATWIVLKRGSSVSSPASVEA